MDYKPRKMIFKAWNTETKLLMRLNSIDCNKGELVKKISILLQFTGLYDKQQDEIYEMDILLIGKEKCLVQWDDDRSGWIVVTLSDRKNPQAFLKENADRATRLWNHFESEKNS